jgi:hypothetical protein
MNEELKEAKNYTIESIISKVITLPGVKVNRKHFLTKQFNDSPCLNEIVTENPIVVGIDRETLKKKTTRLILERTSASSLASFSLGLPGGYAAIGTIPADILQFFGFALRLAQEIAYLYGAEDLWVNETVDDEKIKNQFLLYCGVMFGVSGASSCVRVLSVQASKTAAKKIMNTALTKTAWYPVLKKTAKALGVNITKKTLSNGVSKAIPVIGGVVSGTLNFATMMPMAIRLQKTMDKACFDYSEEEFNADIVAIETEALPEAEDEISNTEPVKKRNILKEKLSRGFNKAKDNLTGWISHAKESIQAKRQAKEIDKDDIFDSIKRLKELYDSDIITEEEFSSKKAELLAKIG